MNMRMSTLDNARARTIWLHQIVVSELKPTKLERSKLINMREFCSLETAEFKSTSYNSLKNACSSILYDPQDSPYSSAWGEIKVLRESAWSICLEKVKKNNPKDKNNHFKEQAKSCLLHSQLCSLAYFELITQLAALTRPANRKLDEKSKRTINQLVLNSRAKFDSIVSTNPNPETDQNIIWLNKR